MNEKEKQNLFSAFEGNEVQIDFLINLFSSINIEKAKIKMI